MIRIPGIASCQIYLLHESKSQFSKNLFKELWNKNLWNMQSIFLNLILYENSEIFVRRILQKFYIWVKEGNCANVDF